MARRTFFSFHYEPDVSRAYVVRNSWVSKRDREDAGFFDNSVFESKKRTGEETLKAFLTDALKGATVTCVLVGAETYARPWVRYELVRSFQQGKGLLGIRVNAIKDLDGDTSAAGQDPFDYLAYQVIGERVYWKEKHGGTWSDYDAVPSMALSDVPYDIGNRMYHTFSTLFRIHNWVDDNGFSNLGEWVESAAKQAGR